MIRYGLPIRRRRLGFLLCAMSVLAGGGLAAAPNGWTTGGPAAAEVAALAVDPTNGLILYSSVYGYGLFRSSDAGASWSRIGPPGKFVSTLAVGVDGSVYAGFGVGGLLTSRDRGLTWIELVPDFPNALHAPYVLFIHVDPADANILYVGRGGVGLSGDILGGLSRSTDRGAHWVSADSGLPRGDARAVASNPIAPAILIAGTGSSGVFKSTNRGDGWSALQAPTTGAVTDVAFNTVNPAVLYVATLERGVFKSGDGGGTFSPSSSGLSDLRITGLAIDPTRPGTLYASGPSGVFQSTDAGGTWNFLNAGLTNLNVRSLRIDSTGLFLHAGTDAGVFDLVVPADPTVLRLNPGRPFSATLSARDPRTGRTASGMAISQSSLFGYFSIPGITGNVGNPEVFVKVLDGTALNGRFWVFYGGLTDLEYTLTVKDDTSGQSKSYTKEAGSPCGGFDTSAFGP